MHLFGRFIVCNLDTAMKLTSNLSEVATDVSMLQVLQNGCYFSKNKHGIPQEVNKSDTFSAVQRSAVEGLCRTERLGGADYRTNRVSKLSNVY